MLGSGCAITGLRASSELDQIEIVATGSVSLVSTTLELMVTLARLKAW
jgi:hypothetical protein